MSYISRFSCKNLVFGMSTFVLDNSWQMTRHAVHQVFAVFNCNFLRPYAFYCHFSIIITCELFTCALSFSIAHKFSIGLRTVLLPGQTNILIFLFLRKAVQVMWAPLLLPNKNIASIKYRFLIC